MIDFLSQLIKQQWITDLTVRFDMFQPTCEILHFIGLTILVGSIGLLDLRMLGIAKGLPIKALHRLVPIGIGGFVLCFLTGFVFLAGDPFREPSWYLRNLSFQLKMLLVALAGVNALLFYVTGLHKKTDALGPNDSAPLSAKIIAATSILLWLGVIYFGRMIPWQDALYMLFEDPSDWG